MSNGALIVLMMMSNVRLSDRSTPSSAVATWRTAPNARESSFFAWVRESTVTSAPMATAILTAMWPSPPRPTTATFLPGPAPQAASGEYVVIPAQSRGAALSYGIASGTRSTKSSFTTTWVEYPPCVIVPSTSTEL